MSKEDGAPECDPRKRVEKLVEKFEAKVRRRAQRLTMARSNHRVSLALVHSDPLSCDTYQRLMVVLCLAIRDWKPDGGMALEAFIDFRIAHTDSDASFFDGPLTVPYGVAMDFLSSRGSSHCEEEQRANWEARGRDPLDFDLLARRHSSLDQQRLPGENWTQFDEATDHPDDMHEMVACTRPDTATLAEAQLFLTQDLTEVERMVLLYHDRDGYTFTKIGRDLLPADLFDNSGNDIAVKHRVRRIYLKAKGKAEDFRNTDGSNL